MSQKHIVLENLICQESVQYAYQRAIQEMDRHNLNFAKVGMRAARAKDHRFMMALEKAANVIQQVDENQRGDTRRQTWRPYAEQVETTETQLWTKAYTCAADGNPKENFMWIYGAAAFLAGYQV